ncbi:MAG: hypothetical protein V2I27_06105 [Erythrobacter sp.]|nr:hypothetical protein [Erythrobacter sp.]
MADYQPYLPQSEPVRVDQGIWTVEGPTVPYKVGPLTVPCPTRSTLLADPQGHIWIHSPVAYSRELHASIEALGPIAGLIAPNSFHHLSLEEWSRHLAGTRIVMAPDLEDRFAALKPQIVALPDFGRTSGPRWLALEVIEGGSWCEIAFYHYSSRSLVLTDILQNFELARINGLPAKALLTLSGARRGPVVSIEMLAMAFRAGKLAKVRESLAKIRRMSARRVLISHGAQPSSENLRGIGWTIDPPAT